MTLAQLVSLIESENELVRPGLNPAQRGTGADLRALAGLGA